MKTIKVEFTVGIGYANATRQETVELDVPENATQDEIEEIIDDNLRQWIADIIDAGYEIIED